MSYQPEATIAAIATAPGEGAIAVVRVSGKESISIVQKIYSGNLSLYLSHTLHLGYILDRNRDIIDQVMVAIMRAPRSYTGEDSVEIQCHGSYLIAQKILSALIENGAQTASPGEFTFRAYMNGKMDLAQAESVQQLIRAKSSLAIRSALDQLEGNLSKKVNQLQEELVSILARMEASINFPEEEIETGSYQEVAEALKQLLQPMEQLEKSFEKGRKIDSGLTLCIIGAPNVGKSSLLNSMVGKEQAIVTEIAGTTRDLIEAALPMNGYYFKLIDTAGIRPTEDIIEQEGIRRAHKAASEADLILFILDATTGFQAIDQQLLSATDPNKLILVWNKVDLPSPHLIPEEAIPISAKQELGLERLWDSIEKKLSLLNYSSKEELILTHLRHQEAVKKASLELQEAVINLNHGLPPEHIALHLRNGLEALSTIIRIDLPEKLLSTIFSQFCIGK